MSKLAKAIDYEIGKDYYYKVAPPKLKYTDVKFSVEDINTDLSKTREYKIAVELKSKAFLSEFDPGRDEVVQKIKRAMIEEVFGEFRPLIYNLHAALYDRNTDGAVKILNELEHVMFWEGLE